MIRNSKTVSAAVVSVFQQRLQGAGMAPEEFWARTGLTAAELQDPGGRIGRERYVRVLRLASALPPSPPDPIFCSLQGVAALPILVGVWLNAPTLRDALRLYVRFRPLLGESDRVVIQRGDAELRIEYLADDPQELAAFQARENFFILAQMIRNHAPQGAVRFAASLTGPCLSDPGLEALLGARCLPDRGENALYLRTGLLDVPHAAHNAVVARLHEHHLSRQLNELHRESSLSLQVERAASKLMAGRTCGPESGAFLEQVCGQVGMSASMLRRRLASERTSLHALWNAARLQEACRLLRETALSVSEIGDRLDFASPSSFTRFFRAETGTSPLRFRARAFVAA